MPVSATNLLVGPGALWSGDFGETEPTNAEVAGAVPAGWTDLGGTDGGVSVTAAREYFSLRVDQVVESPGRRLTELDVSVSTNLAEPTLENWNLALADAVSAITTGGAGAAGWAAMDIGGPDEPGAEPVYKAIMFRGRAPGNKRRLVIIRKALSTDEVQSDYKKDGMTFIPVTFAAHWVSASIKSVHVVEERPIP